MKNQIVITTNKKKQIIDITDKVQEYISQNKYKSGLCHIFIKHTTAAITTADLDPGTELDMLDAFEKVVPKLQYRHPHNPDHAPDHIMSSIIGPDVTVPIQNGELQLGEWQRIIVVELDGPRERSLVVTFIKNE